MNNSIRLKKWALGLTLVGIWLLSVTTHLIGYNSAPPVISHDELYYTVQAKFIALTGSDPTGSWRPWFLTAADPLYAELPGLIMAPAFILSPNNALLASKLTHAMLGSGLVIVLGLLGWTLSKQKTVLWATVFVSLFNPWLFQFSRMGFDSLFSLFFYCLGILIMIHFRNWRSALAVIPFVIGFFQYQGMKIIFLPIVVATFGYVVWRSNYSEHSSQVTRPKSSTWSMMTVLIVCISVFSWFLIRTAFSPDTTRTQSDLIFSQKSTIAAQVDTQRQQALASPLSNWFSNKYLFIGQQFGLQYLASFNLNQLFLTGEPLRNPFSVWKWGMFYPFDLLLISFGWFVLARDKKRLPEFVFLLLLLLIAPLPSAINGKGIWIMFRSSLMIPVLLIVAGSGLAELLKRVHFSSRYIIVGIYLVGVIMFGYEYFFKYPIYGTEGKYFAERIISSYIQRQPAKVDQILVLADEPKFVYEALLTYGSLISQTTLEQVRSSFVTEQFAVNKTLVKNDCVPSLTSSNQVIIGNAATPRCGELAQANPLAIASLLDSGAHYFIYNDTLCSGYSLNRYPRVKGNSLEIESLSDAEFCQTFITRD